MPNQDEDGGVVDGLGDLRSATGQEHLAGEHEGTLQEEVGYSEGPAGQAGDEEQNLEEETQANEGGPAEAASQGRSGSFDDPWVDPELPETYVDRDVTASSPGGNDRAPPGDVSTQSSPSAGAEGSAVAPLPVARLVDESDLGQIQVAEPVKRRGPRFWIGMGVLALAALAALAVGLTVGLTPNRNSSVQTARRRRPLPPRRTAGRSSG
jgi:hypothetical protein